MAYDEKLALRIREVMADLPGLQEKKMFGGVGFLLNGNMACGVNKDDLIVRVGPEAYESALSEAYTSVFDMTGRPMTGWVVVTPKGYETEEALRGWVQRGVDCALRLPHK
jgi:TfoX/Sxy family transcriptional regulator of competence genes